MGPLKFPFGNLKKIVLCSNDLLEILKLKLSVMQALIAKHYKMFSLNNL
jgi:hypothetical protein